MALHCERQKARLGRTENCFAFILHQPIAFYLTCPPRELQSPRAFGNPTAHQFVDLVSEALERIVNNLMPGGGIELNISNDIFGSASIARSLHVERTVIAMSDQLGLHLMDRQNWHNPSKPSGSLQKASRHFSNSMLAKVESQMRRRFQTENDIRESSSRKASELYGCLGKLLDNFRRNCTAALVKLTDSGRAVKPRVTFNKLGLPF